MRIAPDRANVTGNPRLDGPVETKARHGDINADRPVGSGFQAGFDRALDNTRVRREGDDSLISRVERESTPAIVGASLYSGERSIELLQHVVDNILPRLEAEGDATELASQLIYEEIALRQEWEARRAEEIAT
ncbi:hypothetical protein EI168_01480 [Halomonas sp. FME1]|uniref:Uncharacterized protein n=1 Tax=Halomonas casei TaxID=2742613 RepID=A0ABR9EYM8_9GAMM|nr:hypothetical protein [Halomonas casei]MBE0398781.1 hypothetical protein [Halomonas casei]